MMNKRDLEEKKKFFVENVVRFYLTQGRKFPWRNCRDAYKVLVCEVLLRKTTANQVSNLFDEFFSKYPTVFDLAEAPVKEISNIIRPLGMEHKRAKELAKLSRILVEKYEGEIPRTIEELTNLPGVGKYTARAVLSICFGSDIALLDTNVVRILERYFGIKSKRSRAREDPELWKFLDEMVPGGKSKEFNFGLIDLGSMICKPRNPKCGQCPLKEYCNFYSQLGKL